MKDSLLHCLSSPRPLLAEGSIFERLRRDPRVAFDQELAHAALIYEPHSAKALEDVHREYIQIAIESGLGIVTFTDTWRANFERISRSAYVAKNVNKDCATFLCNIRNSYTTTVPIFVGGLIGCRGDAYKPQESLSQAESFKFHSLQVETLASTAIDFLFAATLPSVNEAMGIAKSMSMTRKPYIISFVIGHNGSVLDGTPLEIAMKQIDESVTTPPLGFYINCVHPTVVTSVFKNGPLNRLIGLQGNTSKKSPEDLDGTEELDTQDPQEFAEDMLNAIRKGSLKIAGGCCGTDTRHISGLAEKICAQ